MSKNNQLIIYKTEDGEVKIETHFKDETVWLTQEQIGDLFQRDRSVVSRHIKNIFAEGELEEDMVCANFAHTTLHGAIKGETNGFSNE